MKIYKILSVAALLATSMLTSCVHEGDLNFQKVPDVKFTYEWNSPTLKLTASEGCTDVTWKLLDFNYEASGNSISYTFEKGGSYWVVMNATYKGEQQCYSGKLNLAKTSPIKLDDNSIDDWKQITDTKFVASVDRGLIAGKYDFDANYIYFYYELDMNYAEGLGLGQHVVQLVMDVDGCAADGSDWNMSYDFEGSPAGPDAWGCICDSDWETIEDPVLTAGAEFGSYKVEGNIVKCEFALNRSTFGIKKDAFAFRFTMYDADWNGNKGRFYVNGTSDRLFVIDLTKF